MNSIFTGILAISRSILHFSLRHDENTIAKQRESAIVLILLKTIEPLIYFIAMKKKGFLILFFSIAISSPLMAQTEIGLMLSPALSANRTITENDAYNMVSGTAKLKLSFGAFIDWLLQENYYFSTGLIFAPKNVTVQYTPAAGGPEVEESFNLQYLQVPVSLKLYTNELALDKRIFAQFGILNEVNIDQKPEEKPGMALQKFRFFDFSLFIRGGLDFRVGYNTALFAGLSYSRGLINVLSRYQLPGESVRIKNDLVSLDVGIRF